MSELIAPIAGKVWKILVAVGDKVELDDEMVILEAMKMETPIFSDGSGTISEIKVEEGASVSEGDVLLIMD